MADLHIPLSDDARSFVNEQVASGRFTSAEAFVSSLIDEARHKEARARLEKLLLEGLESGSDEEQLLSTGSAEKMS
jgi:antitoxin ParD1/3/4